MNTRNGHISKKLRYVDLFCGIGGFRFAIEAVCRKKGIQAGCVFSCEIDEECRKSYLANFSDLPNGDITKISEKVVPDREILLAGFKKSIHYDCQKDGIPMIPLKEILEENVPDQYYASEYLA